MAGALPAPKLAGKLSGQVRRAPERFTPRRKEVWEFLRGRLCNYLQGGDPIHPL
jgi:hypothetical protein